MTFLKSRRRNPCIDLLQSQRIPGRWGFWI